MELSVPTSCIVEKADEKFVYVIYDSEPNTVRKIEIKAGEEIQDRTIIGFVSPETEKAVFEKHAKVVILGFESLQDGSNVNIAE